MTLNTEWLSPTYINIAVVVLYVIFMIRGAKRGVLVQVLSSLGTVVSFLAAWRYCSFASGYYELVPKDIVPMNEIPAIGQAIYSHLNEMIWFIALFAVLRLLFVILEKLCSGLSGLPVIKEVSGLLGGLLGVVSATIWILVLFVVLNMPFFRNGSEIANRSLIGTITNKVSHTVKEFAGPIDASETIGNMYQQMNQNNSLREMYGTGAMQQTVQMTQMSPLPTQTNNAPAMVQQQVMPTPVQQAEPVAEHTGRAYDLELNKSEPIGFEIEEDLEPHPDHIDHGSYWEDIIEPVDPNAPKVRRFLDDFQIIWMHMRAAQLKAKHAQIKTTTPVETAEEVVTDINVNNPEIVEPDKFVHVVNYDKITTVHIPFAEGKK